MRAYASCLLSLELAKHAKGEHRGQMELLQTRVKQLVCELNSHAQCRNLTFVTLSRPV